MASLASSSAWLSASLKPSVVSVAPAITSILSEFFSTASFTRLSSATPPSSSFSPWSKTFIDSIFLSSFITTDILIFLSLLWPFPSDSYVPGLSDLKHPVKLKIRLKKNIFK